MKCVICPAEIDETRAVPPIEGPGGRMIEDVSQKLKLARDLEKWSCVMIMAQLSGGCRTVCSGHLCPAHSVDDLTFGLVKAEIKPSGLSPAPVPAKAESKGKS
jgi:hypothetical protein